MYQRNILGFVLLQTWQFWSIRYINYNKISKIFLINKAIGKNNVISCLRLFEVANSGILECAPGYCIFSFGEFFKTCKEYDDSPGSQFVGRE